MFLWKYFLRQIYSNGFCILKLNNSKIIYDLYFQCLNQILFKITFFSNMEGVFKDWVLFTFGKCFNLSLTPHFSSQTSRKYRSRDRVTSGCVGEFVCAAATNEKGECGRYWWTPDATFLAGSYNLQPAYNTRTFKTQQIQEVSLNILLAQRANLRTSAQRSWRSITQSDSGNIRLHPDHIYGPLQPTKWRATSGGPSSIRDYPFQLKIRSNAKLPICMGCDNFNFSLLLAVSTWLDHFEHPDR